MSPALNGAEVGWHAAMLKLRDGPPSERLDSRRSTLAAASNKGTASLKGRRRGVDTRSFKTLIGKSPARACNPAARTRRDTKLPQVCTIGGWREARLDPTGAESDLRPCP